MSHPADNITISQYDFTFAVESFSVLVSSTDFGHITCLLLILVNKTT